MPTPLQACWAEDNRYYDGTVKKVYKDDTCYLTWTDGQTSHNKVAFNKIKKKRVVNWKLGDKIMARWRGDGQSTTTSYFLTTFPFV